jgi:hypothetical protein
MERIFMPLMVLVSFMMIPALGTQYIDVASNAKILCENSSVENISEIILEGENLYFRGLGDLQISGFSITDRMSVLIDYIKHELSIASIYKESDHTKETRADEITAIPHGNESSLKISGMNLT